MRKEGDRAGRIGCLWEFECGIGGWREKAGRRSVSSFTSVKGSDEPCDLRGRRGKGSEKKEMWEKGGGLEQGP